MNHSRLRVIASFLGLVVALPLFAQVEPKAVFQSRADSPPRKVVIATLMIKLRGAAGDRTGIVADLIDKAATEAARRNPDNGLDLVVLPEYALQSESGNSALTRSVSLKDPALLALGAKAREHRTWIIVPMILREDGSEKIATNAAVLLNREGAVAGVYRKVFPVADEHGVLEGGVTPGNDFPVFDCDFGRLGILICYDMSYPASWEALAAAGAEIVAVPSESPQTVRPSAEALQHRYYVVTSTPRANASMFDPIGMTIAQTTSSGVLVHEIDLSYATLHWAPTLQDGRALSHRFGDRVGYTYSSREDTGVFWSNDPAMSIGAMIKQLGFREMASALEYSRQLQDQARRPDAFQQETGTP
jgi:predicted amidohydrolase